MVSVPVIGNRSPGKEKCVEIDDQEYHDTQRLRDSQGVWKFESSRLPIINWMNRNDRKKYYGKFKGVLRYF